MKIFTTLVLLTAIPLLGFYLNSDPGIKVAEKRIQFNNHNPQNGLTLLQNKVNRNLKVEWNDKNSSPVFVGGNLTAKGYAASSDKSVDGLRFLSENMELFGIKNPQQELTPVSNFIDQLSMTHVKYQQQINGIEILDAQLIVHINSDGSIESVNGRYFPTPEINTKAGISAGAAISRAKEKLGNYRSEKESAELIVFARNNHFTLAYEVKLPSILTPNMLVYVDAANGNVLKVDNGIRHEDGPKIGQGTCIDGISRQINTYQNGSDFYLINASLDMYVQPITGFKGVIVTFDLKNDTSGALNYVIDPNRDNNFNDSEEQKACVTAHYFANQAYHFYKNHYNRKSWDNKGTSIKNAVHFRQKVNEPYNNAFWNGEFMVFGDGDGVRFSNLTGAFDVIVHELTHAVTGSTAQLVYENQSGAINESMSDVFATLADSTDWLIGEDIVTPGTPGDGLRSMQDPHNGKPNQDLNAGWLPAHMNEFVQLPNNEENDWGGVHINCGIPNKAFYNVASTIGHWKSGQIWYRSLTVYLTKSSLFSDLRTACVNSAKDLYGEGSAEYNAVVQSFQAVGIGEGSNPGTTTDLTYDDGNPDEYVYETAGNWALAVKFTPPVSNAQISEVKVYISGEIGQGNGSFYLGIYNSDGNNGLPGSAILSPYAYTPQETGWQTFNLNGNSGINSDFYVAVIYDGNSFPAIGADPPPGNKRAYEYDPSKGWYNLAQMGSEYDYTLFMRTTMLTPTGVAEIENKVPEKFEISSNYPNPFNPTTSIKYSLPVGENVSIIIYDITGKEVAKLVNNYQNAGTYVVTWNGKDNYGAQAASGVYLYRIQAGNYVKTQKMTLLK